MGSSVNVSEIYSKFFRLKDINFKRNSYELANIETYSTTWRRLVFESIAHSASSIAVKEVAKKQLARFLILNVKNMS